MEEIFSKDRATGVKVNMPLDRDDQDANKETSEDLQQELEIGEGSVNTKRKRGDETSVESSKKKLKKNNEIRSIQKSLHNFMETMMESSNAQMAQLTSMLEAPKNYKIGLREDLGKVQGISRGDILTLCMKMNECDVALFRDLTDEDEKYELLGMILSRD